jgi:membrane protein implicated in regulation of membrane protease activity
MFGTTDSTEGRPWHAQAGDLLGDDYNVPGLILCALGIVALACTLTAAGSGFSGWTQVGAIATAALWIAGIGALVVEHRREEAIELKYGRGGHAPGHVRHVRYSGTGQAVAGEPRTT